MYLSTEILLNLFNRTFPGLYHGNTSIGLYLGLVDNNMVSTIIKQEVEGLKRISKDLSIKDGVIGVVPVIDMLAKIRTGQSLNALFEEVDSVVFKKAGYSPRDLDIQQATSLSLYLAYRLSKTNVTLLYKSIWSSVLDKVTETILMSIPTIRLDDYHFSLNYAPAFYLLCFLLCLKSGLDKNIFSKKFNAVLPYVVEYVPRSQANKLYYSLVLKGIKNELNLNNTELDNHIKLLDSCILMTDIEDELKNKIYVGDGICGLYLICHYLKVEPQFLFRLSKFVSERLKASAEIQRLHDNPKYLANHIGFWDGVGGILLTLLLIRLNNIRNGINK